MTLVGYRERSRRMSTSDLNGFFQDYGLDGADRLPDRDTTLCNESFRRIAIS